MIVIAYYFSFFYWAAERAIRYSPRLFFSVLRAFMELLWSLIKPKYTIKKQPPGCRCYPCRGAPCLFRFSYIVNRGFLNPFCTGFCTKNKSQNLDSNYSAVKQACIHKINTIFEKNSFVMRIIFVFFMSFLTPFCPIQRALAILIILL